MKLKFSKLKQFQIVTGDNLLELQDKLSSPTLAYNTKQDYLERLALGLHLIANYDVKEAREMFKTLMSNGHEAEKYAIIDDVDTDDMLKEIIKD